MKVTMQRSEVDCTTRLYAEWDDFELQGAKLTPIDRMQLRDPPKTGADILLDAELIVRRIEESQAENEEVHLQDPKS